MYEQLIAPNTNIAWVNEMCLNDVREAFGVTNVGYPTAIANWNASTAANHPNQTPPSNIAVPIYFSYSGPDGHVCLWDNGMIYTSSAQGKQIFTSIAALIHWMGEGFVYLGWSEVIEKTPVVKPGDGSVVIEVTENSPVWTGAGKASSKLSGPVEVGQEYGPAWIMTNGWAQITFTGKEGYIPPGTFRIV